MPVAKRKSVSSEGNLETGIHDFIWSLHSFRCTSTCRAKGIVYPMIETLLKGNPNNRK
jgi:hypothetical protein